MAAAPMAAVVVSLGGVSRVCVVVQKHGNG
jgi:hypothetical protein